MLALSLAAVALYLLAAGLVLRAVLAQADTPRAARGGLVAGLAAVALQLADHAWVAWRVGGADLHFFAALAIVGMGMAALSTAVAWRRPFAALGSVVYPLAALTLLGYALIGPRAPQSLAWPLQLHALLALLAYATLAVGAVLALLSLAQERALRSRRLDSRLLRAAPPLVQLETLLFRTLGAGFVLLSATLLTGVVFVEDLFAQHLVHKTVLSILAWLVFGWLLQGRVRHGWRGAMAVRLVLVAMALLLLAFFGSNFVLDVLKG
jgi:ABC-type uncharacterized transport system permease subunit